MRVHRSNSVGELLRGLANVVDRRRARPFSRETIVVQGKGMERWISMELARRFGVWANPEFPFPRTVVNRAIGVVFGEEAAERGPFEPEALVWSVAKLLPELLQRDEGTFWEIGRYLGTPPPPGLLPDGEREGREGSATGSYDRRLLQLSRRVSEVFGTYVLYRPDMLRRWEESREQGYETGWQPILWRELVNVHGRVHLAARVEDLVRALSAEDQRPPRPSGERKEERGELAHLPGRMSVFGVSTLAPVYMDAFGALSRVLDVELFLLTPSREFMGGVPSRKEVLRERQRRGPDADLHDEIVNPLVASLGTLGRDFQSMLEEWGYSDDEELFVNPLEHRSTMLAAVQSDMLHLRDRRDGSETAPLAVADTDDSIQVHVCHSPMREVEVLHDRLLALFAADESLEPRDVVVMAPSIDEYAPYVDAVFGADRSRPAIPYHIADRAPRLAERVIDAFFRILEVLRGRMTAPEVFDLLAMEPVRERFEVSASELETIRSWISDSGIRWAVDADDRAEFRQPGFRENTWRFGLERLFLGVAMAPDDDAGPWEGVLPVDGIEGTGAELLGRVASFLEALFGFRATVGEAATVPEWAARLRRILGTLVSSTPATADQHRQLFQALEKMEQYVGDAGFDREMRIEAVLPELEGLLAGDAPAYGLLSGGVTFCAMLPMRSIPFRVVCLVGMNDGDFPRTVRPPGFDLTTREHQKGDRTRRDDDRHLFLESVLSAEEKLVVTYVGQSIRDNSAIPPSVVVSELLDFVGTGFFREADGDFDSDTRRERLLDRVVLYHPLQGFSGRYFTGEDERLVSYSESAFAAARANEPETAELRPFVEAPLPSVVAPGEAPVVALSSLERFFEHSLRWFCQERLGLWLGKDVTLLGDREPVELDNLERWAIGDALLPRLVRGRSEDEVLALLAARGVLPPGALGQALYREILGETRRIAALACRYFDGERREPVPVETEIAGMRLVGTVGGLFAGRQIDCRYSKLGGKHETRFWLRHLVLQALREDGADVPGETVLLGRPAKDGEPVCISFGSVRDARELLAGLVEIFRVGAEAPVPLFPRVSRLYVETLLDGKGNDPVRKARSTARAEFRRLDWADGNDDYVARVLGDEWEPGEADLPGAHAGYSFEDVARQVFEPLLAHRRAVG